jgi:tetratricopeptide (TPR) repeat protein
MTSEVDAVSREAYSLRFRDQPKAYALASGVVGEAERTGNRLAHAYALLTAVIAHHIPRSELDAAEINLSLAREHFVSCGDESGIAAALSSLGCVYKLRGELAASMKFLYGALEVYDKLGEPEGRAHALTNMGATLYHLGEYDRGLEVTSEAHRLLAPVGEPGMLTKCVNNMGNFYGELGDLRSAADWHARAAQLSRQYGDQVTEALSLMNLGYDYKLLGEYDPALSHLAAAHALAQSIAAPHIEADTFRYRGEIHLASGDVSRAVWSFRCAIRIARENGLGLTEIEGNLGLGAALLANGRTKEAIAALSGTLANALEAGARPAAYEAHERLARAYETSGDLRATLVHERAFHRIRNDVFSSNDEAIREQRLAVAEVERLRHESELASARTELRLLKAQLQPHFMLNALNNVSTLIHIDPHRADRMIERLGNLLRMSIVQSQRPAIKLQDELHFVRAYLEVEQIRLDGALQVEVEVDPRVLACEVPHLLLQPLVENAIRHGFSGLVEAPRLFVRAQLAAHGSLVLTVEDNGVGLPPGWTMKRAGTGLRNTAQRLKFLYPGEHTFQVASAETGGVRVDIQFPSSLDAPVRRATPARPSGRGGRGLYVRPSPSPSGPSSP